MNGSLCPQQQTASPMSESSTTTRFCWYQRARQSDFGGNPARVSVIPPAGITPDNRPRQRAPISTDRRHYRTVRRRDVGHLDVEFTIEDPKIYNKPISFKVTHLLEVDSDIIEYFCNEGEKDFAHIVK